MINTSLELLTELITTESLQKRCAGGQYVILKSVPLSERVIFKKPNAPFLETLSLKLCFDTDLN